jgi:hypothetical protein
MRRLLKSKWLLALIAFGVLDLVCAGIGMGVPIFCILLGFPFGWYVARRVARETVAPSERLRKAFVISMLVPILTYLLMLVIWGPTAAMLFDPNADIANFGIPMILYDPVASFIGWLVLMIFISPFLQLLTTVFAGYIVLMSSKPALEAVRATGEPTVQN